MCRFLLVEDVNMFGTLTLCNTKKQLSEIRKLLAITDVIILLLKGKR